MDSLSYKTKHLNQATVVRKWYIIDAENQVVGRLASRIANIIRGKHNPNFTSHFNSGDKVVVINADKVRFTGKKLHQKQYIHYTGYPGGQRFASPVILLKSKPVEVLKKAVTNMLPHNKLRAQYLTNLYLYTGTNHPHTAQAPKEVDVTNRKKSA